MKPNTQKIINELLEIDPSLKSKKKELEKLVSQLIKSKPDFKINQAFIVELKEALYEETEAKKQNIILNFFKMKTFQSFGAGALLTALLLTPLLHSMWEVNQPITHLDETSSSQIASESITESKIEITEDADFVADDSIANSGFGGLAQNSIIINPLEKEAFGSLSSPDDTQTESSFSLKSGKSNETLSPEMTAMESNSTRISPKTNMPYNPTKYEYIYDGDLTIDESEINVYRKQPSPTNINANALLSALNLELIDSSGFKNITAQNISIKENRKFGYTINLYNNDNSSSISIYKNWDQWPNPNDNCSDPKCYERNQLTAEDVPSDAELIQIADTFASKLKIDMSPYGDPTVKKQVEMRMMEARAPIHIQEEMTVVYPILIDGQEVQDESGNPTGLNIEIDIRHKKASGLNGLTTQTYDSAEYQAVSLEKLQTAIQKGTHRQNNYFPEDAKVVKLKLGEPTQILTKIWHWDTQNRKNNELLVPALHFPILEKADDVEYFYRDSIVIPLAKDLFEEDATEPVLYRGDAEPMLAPETE